MHVLPHGFWVSMMWPHLRFCRRLAFIRLHRTGILPFACRHDSGPFYPHLCRHSTCPDFYTIIFPTHDSLNAMPRNARKSDLHQTSTTFQTASAIYAITALQPILEPQKVQYLPGLGMMMPLDTPTHPNPLSGGPLIRWLRIQLAHTNSPMQNREELPERRLTKI